MAAVTVGDGVYQVYAGEVFTYTGDVFGLFADAPGHNPGLVINGSVTTSGSGTVLGILIGSSSFYDSTVVIGGSGVLKVSGVDAYGYSSGSWSPDFTNKGLFQVTGSASAHGLVTWDAGPWLFDNQATFAVQSDHDAYGVQLANAGTFHNSGTMTVTGGTQAVGLGITGFDGDFLNTGSLVVRSAAHNAIGVAWSATFATGLTWENRGTIDADVALRVSTYSGLEGGDRTFTNNGLMIGAVELGDGHTVLVNNKTINGDVDLGTGDDTYDGRLGVLHGSLNAGDGADSVAGGSGAETLSGGTGSDTISGGGGDDLIDGGRDSDLLDGGAGVDTVTYQAATMGVSLDFSTGRADSSGSDTLSGFENAIGGAYADTLTGGSGAQSLFGGAGDDVIRGGAGPNYLRGDEGADSIAGGAGFDDINGNMGADTIVGGAGGDWLVGGKDNDSITATEGNAILYGNMGDDTLVGSNGACTLRGGQNDDQIRAGSGSDWISGDLGSDTLTGGAGADTFHISSGAGLDQVTDFHRAEGDRVLLDAGATYTLSQAGADTVVDLGGGTRMVLQNVQLATLGEGWLVVG